MIAGKDAPTFGEAKNSWLTGTSAWTFVSISQSILGIKPALDGLEIDPCIPSWLAGYTVKRRFRGAAYVIAVSNPDGVQHGICELAVNGNVQQGRIIPPCRPRRGRERHRHNGLRLLADTRIPHRGRKSRCGILMLS